MKNHGNTLGILRHFGGRTNMTLGIALVLNELMDTLSRNIETVFLMTVFRASGKHYLRPFKTLWGVRFPENFDILVLTE